MNIEPLKRELEEEIKHRNYDSLVYVLFDESNTAPFAIHIFYRDHLFMVNSRDDRSYIVGHSKEYNNFESAKKDFFEKLELVIESNKLNIQLGLPVEYPSPLWDEKEDH